jgi:hypothetical protein
VLIAQRPCSCVAARARNFCELDTPEAQPEREATIVAIGIHPFLAGTPDGADALRRVVENFKNQKLVWVTDVKAVLDVADRNRRVHARINISSHLRPRSINVIFLSS